MASVVPVLVTSATFPVGVPLPVVGLTAIVAVTEVPAATVVAPRVRVVVVAAGVADVTPTGAEALAVKAVVPAYFAVTV